MEMENQDMGTVLNSYGVMLAQLHLMISDYPNASSSSNLHVTSADSLSEVGFRECSCGFVSPNNPTQGSPHSDRESQDFNILHKARYLQLEEDSLIL
jgi:hypothetical protein